MLPFLLLSYYLKLFSHTYYTLATLASLLFGEKYKHISFQGICSCCFCLLHCSSSRYTQPLQVSSYILCYQRVRHFLTTQSKILPQYYSLYPCSTIFHSTSLPDRIYTIYVLSVYVLFPLTRISVLRKQRLCFDY